MKNLFFEGDSLAEKQGIKEKKKFRKKQNKIFKNYDDGKNEKLERKKINVVKNELYNSTTGRRILSVQQKRNRKNS